MHEQNAWPVNRTDKIEKQKQKNETNQKHLKAYIDGRHKIIHRKEYREKNSMLQAWSLIFFFNLVIILSLSFDSIVQGAF